MKKRIISGIIITILAVVLGLTKGLPLGIALMICSVIGYYEMTRALSVHGEDAFMLNGRDIVDGHPEKATRTEKLTWNVMEAVGMITSIVFWCVLMYFGLTDTDGVFVQRANMLTILMILTVFFVNMSIYVLTFPKYEAHQVVGSIFAFLYGPVMISCIFRAAYLPFGTYIYALVFFCSWICDTCAFAVGVAFGKHKVAPILSPKKTIEGCIGGVAGSVIMCIGAAIWAERFNAGANLIPEFALIGVAGSLFSMIGDLGASAIKRNHKIKDYGKCIPGHGGILDRFDSIIFTAPVIYYLGVLLLTVLREVQL